MAKRKAKCRKPKAKITRVPRKGVAKASDGNKDKTLTPAPEVKGAAAEEGALFALGCSQHDALKF
jgi:hypothetical protein